jgi:hypothetical protein
MKAAREREMSEMWPQNGHWCRMEEDMVVKREEREDM